MLSSLLPAKGKRWPVIIVGLLSLHFCASIVFVYIATTRPSSAVEENYYQKALKWDEKRQQDELNRQLGWVLEARMKPISNSGQASRLDVKLSDRHGQPISDAAISAECFAVARSNQILHTDLRETSRGFYSSPIDARRPGLWELRLLVERGAERFTARSRVVLTTELKR